MYVYDIISDAQSVLGRCTDEVLFRRITDAVKLANNQGKFDAALSQMDICTYDRTVTLPADVGTVLAVNTDGYPTLVRDQWFQYHINGGGTECYVPWQYTNELGMVSTYKDPPNPCILVAVVENPADSNTPLRIFGWDSTGKRIYTPDANGVLQDGFLVPTVFGYPTPQAGIQIQRIDRIQKCRTNGFVQLLALDPTTLAVITQIGYYLPWETNPYYRRIQVPDRSWVRIKYRKRDLEIHGTCDWINIENREALMLLLKAIKFRLDNQIDQAKNYEAEGMRLLSNEAEALRPSAIQPPQVIFADGPPADYVRDELYLHY